MGLLGKKKQELPVNAGVELGDYVKDVVTGFEGIAYARDYHLHGCDRIEVSPTSLDDNGNPKDAFVFDILRLTVIEKGRMACIEPNAHFSAFTMGAKVKDTITGFEGIIGTRTEIVTGLTLIGIMPTVLSKEGALKDAKVFPAGRVELIAEQPVPVAPEAPKGKPGGPTERRSAAKAPPR
jgi:hypothetical protein